MLLNYETNQTKADPITKEEGEGDSICIKDNVEEVELSDIYISRTFGDEYEAYNAYNLYVSAKGFGIYKSMITKSRTN